ncbi:uncharacterized protein G2W53_014571 [Senna tora]|uniref:Uncharacterized protein n=1 Tax=Senna tora TaxID=362788 RepID=A0A834WTH8_9FABA|nr:uncharacterized protein G2W53_014571 [Senna tora]
MTSQTLHAITNPIRPLNPHGFPNTTRINRPDLRNLPCDHESDSAIKSTRIRKYNAKRSARHDTPSTGSRVPFEHQIHSDSKIQRKAISLTHFCNNTFELDFLCSFDIQSRISVQNMFSHEFTHLPCDHESDSTIKSTQIPKYNAKQSNAFEIQSRFSIQNVFRQDFTDLPSDHESHLSIKSTRIPKYIAKRSV